MKTKQATIFDPSSNRYDFPFPILQRKADENRQKENAPPRIQVRLKSKTEKEGKPQSTGVELESQSPSHLLGEPMILLIRDLLPDVLLPGVLLPGRVLLDGRGCIVPSGVLFPR